LANSSRSNHSAAINSLPRNIVLARTEAGSSCNRRKILKERDMSDIKKDHSIGSGTGAAAGAVTGATIGSVGGPVGMAAGAVVGGIVGAAAGDSNAEAVNPTTYGYHWK
jgi:phage tail tape-measure protein